MEKLKSNLPNMVGVLTIVCVLCGGILAYVNNLTRPMIDEQAEKALADGIKAVLAANDVKVEKTETVVRSVNGKELEYILYSTDKGVAVQAVDPNAFGGNLKVLVGFNDKGDILGYTVLEHAETPGLGAKVNEWFQTGNPGCIVGKNAATTNLTVSKDGGEVDAITASTITSRAFLRAVQQAYQTMDAQVNGNEQTDGNTSATAQSDATTSATAQNHE